MSTVVSILSLYAWVLVSCVIAMLLLVARFYEKKYAELYDDASHKHTFYQFFPIPLALFLVAAVRYVVLDEFAGDVWGDLAFFLGGAVLASLSYHVQRLMTGGRQ